IEAGASMNQLHAHDGSAQRDDGEFAQGRGRLNLAFFEIEPLALQGSKELLDLPAPTIVGDGLVCVREGLDGSTRQQPPMNRLDACRRTDLADIEDMDRDARLQIPIGAVLRPGEADGRKTQDHFGVACGAAWNGGEVKNELLLDWQAVEISKE